MATKTISTASPVTLQMATLKAYGSNGNPPSTPAFMEASGSFVLGPKTENVGVTSTATSHISPNWNVPKTRYVSVGSTKKPPKIKRPVEPIPVRMWKHPSRPLQRHGTSDASFARALRKWGARVSLVDKRNLSIAALNARRLAAHKQKIDRYYAKLLQISKSKSYRTMARGKVIHTVNNPYTKTKVVDTYWQYACGRMAWIKPKVKGGVNVFCSSTFPGRLLHTHEAWFGTSSNPGLITTMTGPALPQSYTPSNEVAIATAKSLSNFFQKLGDQKVHIGNIVAERAQTYGMVTESIARLANFLKSPKKQFLSYIKSDGNFGKRTSSDFLQYSFGVEPLASDVYSSLEAFNSALSRLKGQDMVKVRSGGSHTFVKESKSGVNTDLYIDHFRTECTVKVRHMSEYRIDIPAAASLGSLGLINPAEILWEVTPWSFVIDWALPVGKYISSLTADTGLTWKSGTMSVEITTTRTTRRVFTDRGGIPDPGSTGVFYGTITRTQTTVNKNRYLLNAAPVPGLPRFKNPFSPKHVALGLALWRQRR